jgi:hypothetical protein
MKSSTPSAATQPGPPEATGLDPCHPEPEVKGGVCSVHELLNRPGQAALLWVYGPGGVGKSTLLNRLGQLVSDKGMPVLFPDARDLPPTREGVVQGLQQALEPAITSVEDGEQRWVILLDTCEHFSEAEASAVRTEVLSQLPATAAAMNHSFRFNNSDGHLPGHLELNP